MLAQKYNSISGLGTRTVCITQKQLHHTKTAAVM